MIAQGKRPSLSLAALLITTLAAAGVLITRGPSCGHDFDFHLVSWMEAANAWRSGILYPHWAASANYGAGEPRFVFYPPASWMLGALLGTLFKWPAVPLLFTAICFFSSGLAMRRLAQDYLTPLEHFYRRCRETSHPSRGFSFKKSHTGTIFAHHGNGRNALVATAAGCLYIANPYMLFVAYERTAYGELMAAALVPLLLAFSLHPRPPIVALAATVAAIWLVNAPAGVMACYVLLWIALLRLILPCLVSTRLVPPRLVSDRTWQPTLRIGGATALGLGLAAFYLVPAVYQQRWVDIVRAVAPGMRFADSFLFHHTGEPFHDSVLHTASVIACILLGIAFASALLWREALRERRLLQLSSLAPLILVLLVPVSAPLWRYAPRLQYVQFPWRWLLILAPVTALLAAGALARRLRPIWLIAATVALCALSIVPCTRIFHQYCDDEDTVAAQTEQMHAQTGEEGTDEYTPRNDDNAEVDQDLPQVRVLIAAGAEEPDSSKDINPEWQPDARAEYHASIAVSRWSAEHRIVTVDTPAAGFAVFRLMDYPAWTVLLNDALVSDRPRRDDGLLTVPVPKGHSQIEIRWRTTKDLWIGRLLSLLSLCACLALWSRERRDRGAAAAPTL